MPGGSCPVTTLTTAQSEGEAGPARILSMFCKCDFTSQKPLTLTLTAGLHTKARGYSPPLRRAAMRPDAYKAQ